MLKQKRQLFEFLFMGADLVVVTVAWFIAYWLRFQSALVPVDKGVPPFNNYLSMVLFIWLIWAFVFKRMGLYRPMRGQRGMREMWLLINANALALLMFIAVTYLFREKSAPFSRLVFFYFGAAATVLTIAQRASLRYLLREVRRRGYNLRYLLIVGAGKLAGDIATRIRLHRELGIQLVGCLSKEASERKGPKGIPVVGKYSELKGLLQKMEIDQVVVALPLEDNQTLPDIMDQCRDSTADVKIVPDIYQFVSLGGSVEEFEGLPVITLQESPLDGINLFTKRIFDLLLAVVLIVLLSPVFLLIALLVKLTSRGPIFYRQQRVSFDGSRFTIFKFRTMYTDAERDGPGWSTPGDSRITPLGKFLRAYSLDEFPQLFNVIRGDMSLVGPRPERPVFIEEFRQRIPRYMLRHKVPAGMTGWAQINGWRGDTSIDKRIEYDLYYIENWSLLLDFKIVMLTLFHGLKDRNVA
jgi:Undecaprenyl-phosphate glucose phosphotransferase